MASRRFNIACAKSSSNGADVIKICATGGVLSKGDDPNASQYTLEEMKAIVADAHRLGRKSPRTRHGAEGVRWASEAGVDSIEHGHLMDDAAIATLKKNGTYLVPTLFLGEYMEKNMEPQRRAGILEAENARRDRGDAQEHRESVCRRREGGIRHGCGGVSARTQRGRIPRLRESRNDAACSHPDCNDQRIRFAGTEVSSWRA